MDKESIKRYFESEIYTRGLDYYKRSKVSNMVLSGNTVTAMVSGSENKKYIVNLLLSSDKESVKKIACSCPCDFNCKHAAAVLLLYAGSFEGRDHEEELKNPIENDGGLQKSIVKVIELDRIVNSLRLNDLFEKYGNVTAKKVFLTGNFQAALAVDFEYSGIYNSSVKWFISPAYRTIKKDGSLGKIEVLKKEKPGIEVSENIKELYEELSEGYSFQYKLDKHIDQIIQKRLPVYNVKKKEPLCFEFEEIRSIDIYFKLYHFYDNNLIFTPAFCIKSVSDKEYNLSGNNIINSNKFLSFPERSENRILFFNKKNTGLRLADLLYTLCAKNMFFNLADIKKLKETVENLNEGKNVSVRFNYKKVEIIKTIPKVIIEIEEQPGTLEVKILFDYDGNILYYSNNINDYIVDAAKSREVIFVYLRNHSFEKEIIKYLKNKFFASVYDVKESYFDSKYFVIVLRISVKDFLINYAITILDEGYQIRYAANKEKIGRNRGRLKINIKTGIEWFDIKGKVVSEDDKELDFSFSKEDAKKGLIKINGSFVILSKEDILKLGKFIDAGMDEKGNLSVNKLHFNKIDSLYSELSEKEPDVERTINIINKLKDFKEIKSQKVSPNFKAELRDYQQTGFEWLYFLFEYSLNGCLADDMGLGKTVQTLCFLQKLKDEKKLGLVLLLAPVSTIVNWESEINRFTPHIKSIRHFGQERNKDEDAFKNTDIIITSYHTFRNDIDFFKSLKISYFILDEAQNIKNAGSLIFKSVKLIEAKHKLTLTGTPVENNTLELWAQMDFLNPGVLGSINDFKKNFANNIEKYSDKDRAKELKDIVKPFILRRKKEDVAKDLPDKEEVVYYCEMGEKQRNFYESIKDFYFNKISDEMEKNGKERSAFIFFEGILRLRQALLFPGIIDEKNESIPSCKSEALSEILDEIIAEDHKALLFSQFVETLKRLGKDFKKKKIDYSYLDGSTKSREKEIKKFQEDENVKLFLISLKAGGVGINLTSADYVVLFDPWWNPAVERQAVDRAHRIGQKKKVIVYKLIVKESIEEKIMLLQEKKKALVADLIHEDAGFFKALSKDDLLGLFK